MNQTIDVIKQRRSIRSYKEEQISEAELQMILEAGVYAPSGNNLQSWHFTVVQDKKVIRDLNNETKAILAASEDPFLRRMGNNEEFNVFCGAPTVVIVSGNEENANSAIDCALATENMMIAAQSLGVSSCYIISVSFLFDSADGEYFYEKLGIPAGYKVYNAVLLGYNKNEESPKAAPRKDGSINYIR